VAIVGATLFAKVSEIRGNKYSLLVMNVIWVFICLGAYFVTKEIEFYLLATVVGLVMGGIQSLSRSTFAKLIPKNTTDHASFFSFYDVTYNLSIVFGTFSYGAIEQLSGSMRNSTLALGLFFVLGIIFLTQLKVKVGKL
jgi:UMF1 family MFS transporter